jgi:hypothetical protein
MALTRLSPVDSGTASFAGAGPGSSALSLRNVIINGDMRIDQRNSGGSVTHSGASNLYVLDRFVTNSTGTGQYSVQQVADAPAGFKFSSKLTVTTSASPAAGDFSYYGQYIEGSNVQHLNFGLSSALTQTLSFWIKSSLTGSFSGALRNGAATRAYPFSFTIINAATWEYKTVVIPGDQTGTWATDNTIGAALFIDTGSGSTNRGTAGAWAASANTGVTSAISLVATAAATMNLTGVQLEVGSIATPFERRPIGFELSLAQRYFQWCPFNIQYRTSSLGSDAVENQVIFPVVMRAVPTAGSLVADPLLVQQTNNIATNLLARVTNSGATVYLLAGASANISTYVIGYRVSLTAEL